MKHALTTAACALALSMAITTPAAAKDWKARLADKGVSVEAAYTIDTVSVSGGVDSDTYTLDNLDVIVDVDLDKALGWSGMQLHVYGLANNGDMPNDGAGPWKGSTISKPDCIAANCMSSGCKKPLRCPKAPRCRCWLVCMM